MQTEDLILWVDKAKELRESSFVPPKRSFDISDPFNPDMAGKYLMPTHKAIEQTKPEEAKDYDLTIALMLVEYSNDIADWKKQIKDSEIINIQGINL